MRVRINKLKDTKKSLVKLAKKVKKDSIKKKKNVPLPVIPVNNRQIVPFDHHDSILLIGEGNFSFSNALVNTFNAAENITATCLDSETVLHQKYSDAQENIENLNENGGTVIYDFDCTSLKCAKSLNERFDKIVFNFPHVGLGIKDQDRNIIANQKLISSFIKIFAPKLSSISKGDSKDGEIIITVKTGTPYDLWNVKKIGKDCNVVCKTSFQFQPQLYEGYEHRRSLGFKDGLSVAGNSEILRHPPRTFCFMNEKSIKNIVIKTRVESDEE